MIDKNIYSNEVININKKKKKCRISNDCIVIIFLPKGFFKLT